MTKLVLDCVEYKILLEKEKMLVTALSKKTLETQ